MWAVTTAAALLFGLAAGFVLKAAAGPTRLRWAWLAVLLAAAGGVLVWMRRGGFLSTDCGYVVVVSADAPPRDVADRLRRLPESPVSFVVLDEAPAAAAPGSPSWTSTAGLDEARVRAAMSTAVKVGATQDDWGGRLFDACAANVDESSRRWLWRQPVVLAFPDDGGLWRRNLGEFSTGNAVSSLATAGHVPLYVWPVRGSRTAGRLTVTPSQAVLPAGTSPPDWVGAKVAVTLSDYPESVGPAGLRAAARLMTAFPSADGSAPVTKTFSVKDMPPGGKFEPVPGPGRAAAYQFPLHYLGVEGDPALIGEGLHLLEVTVTAADDSGQSFSYTAATYLQTRSANVLVLADDGRPGGGLADDTWAGPLKRFGPASDRPSIEALYRSFERRAAWGQGARAPKSRVDFGRLPAAADAAAEPQAAALAKALAGGVRGLVLVEPTAEQLAFLDEKVGLGGRIQRGLNVMVIGPPVAPPPTARPLPGWLPAVAAAAPKAPGGAGASAGARPVRVHRDTRVFVMFDASRVMRLPLWDVTPMELQVAAANAMAKELGFEADFFQAAGGRVYGRKEPREPTAVPTPFEHLKDRTDGITLEPAATYFVADRKPGLLGADDFANGAGGYVWDVAPGDLGIRINGLFHHYWESAGTPPPPPGAGGPARSWRLTEGDLYPNTHVVAFVSTLPQSDAASKAAGRVSGGVNPDGAGTVKLFNDQTQFPGWADLLDAGVRLHRVKIDPGLPAYAEALKGGPSPDAVAPAGPGRPWYLAPRALAPGDDALSVVRAGAGAGQPDVRREQAKQLGKRLAAAILGRRPGVTDVLMPGRVVDQRVPRGGDARPAPEEHLILVRPTDQSAFDPDGFDRPAAVVKEAAGPGSPASGSPASGPPSHNPLPLIVDVVHGQGQVVVLGYSPFAIDVWNRDAGPARWAGAGDEKPDYKDAQYEGWGVQRLIDFVTLAGAVRPITGGRVTPSNAAISADAADFDLICFGNFGSAAWQLPQILRPSGPPARMDLAELNLADRTARFRYHATAGPDLAAAGESDGTIDGPAWIELGDGSGADGGGVGGAGGGGGRPDRLAAYLRMRPSKSVGLDAAGVLGHVATFSGGRRVDRQADLPAGLLQSSAWAGVLGLTAAAFLVFCPPATSWAAARQLLMAWWRRGRLRSRSAPEFADALLADWGLTLGKPVSGRVAGVPGPEKPFESGDRLSSARTSTLLPFTAIRRTIALPQRPPLVRVKFLTHSVDALILLDHTAGLAVPRHSRYPTKADAAAAFAAVIAAVTWRQGGSVGVASTARGFGAWGPNWGAGSAEDMDRFVRRVLTGRQLVGRKIVVPEGTQPGATVYLLTDVPSRSAVELAAFLSEAIDRTLQVRLAQFVDPTEYSLTGMGRAAGSIASFDRTGTDGTGLREAYARAAAEAAQPFDETGNRSLLIDTSVTAGELLQLIVDGKFFEPS